MPRHSTKSRSKKAAKKKPSTSAHTDVIPKLYGRNERKVMAHVRNRSLSGKHKSWQVLEAEPSEVSSLGRQGLKAFISGVQRELRSAHARGIAVAIQTKDGNIIHAIPSKKNGSYVVLTSDNSAGVGAKRDRGSSRTSR